MAKSRFRLRFPFWLDLTKPEEQAIAETIEELKQQRSFARTVREGIKLVCELRAGRTDYLFELFPWLREALLQPDGVAGTPDPLAAQLDRVERLLLEELIRSPMVDASPKPSNSIGSEINTGSASGPAVDLDDLDDLFGDDDNETVKVNAGANALQNFRNSIQMMKEMR